MQRETSQPQSVARRLTLLSIGIIAAILALLALGITLVAGRTARLQVQESVADKVMAIVKAMDNMDDAQRELVERAAKTLQQSFEATMTLDEASGEMKSYGAAVNNNFGDVDTFTGTTGNLGTVFAKKGDDFVRITSSLKKPDGERAIGINLDRAHPAYKAAQSGQGYTGREVLFGKPYMTHYAPLKNADGKLIGLLSASADLTALQGGLSRQVAETRFFDTGGVYAIDPRTSAAEAVFVLHPSAAGKKVTEVAPQAKDFLEALGSADDGRVDGAPALLDGTSTGRWALMRKTQSGGTWVVAEVSQSESTRSHWTNMLTIWALLAAATVALGGALFVVVRRTVSQPLGELTTVVKAVADGDLTHSFTSQGKDEIGALVREVEGMRLRYQTALAQVRESVDSIGTASAEIASGNMDLSTRTEQTSSNLQRTASSMDTLTATVRQSADAANQANRLAASAAEVAARGGAVVGQVVTTMDDINQSSRKIADIISVIDGIAFQTNILALNAAVEAARAGEQGRGFAVVASEVRNLAGRSADAAKEIKALIGASVDKVTSGSTLVQNAGVTMNEIVQSVQRVSDIIGEISSASAEQSAGIGEVNTAVAQLDQMTQQNAALVEQSAAAADNLKDQAQRLAQAVSVFRLGDTHALIETRSTLGISNQIGIQPSQNLREQLPN
jgi:methyl-accepting chemotaxis protein-2 (aspartate sensor receptor)